jgi:uncharacterized protein YjiS (DUF1127 family)
MLSFLSGALQAWKAYNERRAAVRALESLNDHQLADIGIERGFIVEAVSGQNAFFAQESASRR